MNRSRGKKMNRVFMAICAAAVVLAGCAKSQDVFEDVGEDVAGPSAMLVDADSGRLYLVNSNSRVLYDWHQGNFQVLDISDPTAPELIKSVPTRGFSGGIYFDKAASKIYMPNRYSADESDETGELYLFSTDESDPDKLLEYTISDIGKDAFSIACCHPAGRMWLTTSQNKIQYIDIGGDLAPRDISLLTTFDDGSSLGWAETYHMVINANQGFLTRRGSGVMIMNLDEAGVADAYPMDYFIQDLQNPLGVAYREGILYVVGMGDEDGEWRKYLALLDVSALTPVSGNKRTKKLDKDDEGILLAMIDVGENPQEVLLSTDYAFVTNIDDDTVSVIDLSKRKVVKTIEVGEEPFSLGLCTYGGEEDSYLYVGNVQSNTLSIIDLVTLEVVATYP